MKSAGSAVNYPGSKSKRLTCSTRRPGKKTLADLFEKRSQLIIYHFMFGPDPKWKEGCPNYSFLVDHIDGANLHLAHHDVTLLVVSRAPLSKIKPFKKRMGWRFQWVSSFGNDFNFDYDVSSTKNEIAKAKFTIITRQPKGAMNSRASAFSARTRAVSSFTLIPPTGVEGNC